MLDIRMTEAEHRYQRMKVIARGFGVICVCAVALIGWLAKFYVG